MGNCSNCEYWKKRDTDDGNGTCYENSPQVVMMEVSGGPNAMHRNEKNTTAMSVWPATNKNEWCGKHKIRS